MRRPALVSSIRRRRRSAGSVSRLTSPRASTESRMGTMLRGSMPMTPALSAALNAGYSRAFVVAAGLAVASALAAFIVPTIRGHANAGR
jgi:hypothetical protein